MRSSYLAIFFSINLQELRRVLFRLSSSMIVLRLSLDAAWICSSTKMDSSRAWRTVLRSLAVTASSASAPLGRATKWSVTPVGLPRRNRAKAGSMLPALALLFVARAKGLIWR